MSVRIKYGGNDKSLARRLLGSYGDNSVRPDDNSEFDIADLENPLLGDHK